MLEYRKQFVEESDEGASGEDEEDPGGDSHGGCARCSVA